MIIHESVKIKQMPKYEDSEIICNILLRDLFGDGNVFTPSYGLPPGHEITDEGREDAGSDPEIQSP